MMDFDFRKIRKEGEFLLITTDSWFYGPDGRLYNGVWGKAKVIEFKKILGFAPRKSENWSLVFGGDRPVFIAGCQIHYAVMMFEKPENHAGIWIAE